MSEPGRVDLAGAKWAFGASLTGKRERDEDFVACEDFGGVRIGVLCDGMGGGKSGEMASEIAARGFLRGIGSLLGKRSVWWELEEKRRDAYAKLVEKCHDAVCSMAGGAGISGTTLTAIVASYDNGTLGFVDLIHIGDSRCYEVCSGAPRLVTRDHSVTGDMVRAGYIEIHEIEETSGRNTLTRNIGDENRSMADITTLELEGNCCFLLCCDGVWGPLHGKSGFWRVEDFCSQHSADEIVAESIKRGSTDNCSVLILQLNA